MSSKCKYQLEYNNSKFEFPIEGDSNASISDVVEQLKKSPNLQDALSFIRKAGEASKDEELKLTNLDNRGLVSNMSFKQASTYFKNFPLTKEGTPIQLPNMGLVVANRVLYDGVNKSGIVNDANGNKFYIVNTNNMSINTFYEYLKNQDAINKLTIDQAKEALGDIVDKVAGSTEKLQKELSEYIINPKNKEYKQEYIGSYVKETLLHNLMNVALGKATKVFKSPFAENISDFIGSSQNKSLTQEQILDVLHKSFNEQTEVTVGNQTFDIETQPIELFKELMSSPEIGYTISKIDKNRYYFKKNILDLKDKVYKATGGYDVTNLCREQEEFNGFKIYKVNLNGTDYFFPSAHPVSIYSQARLYPDIEKVRQSITGNLKYSTLETLTTSYYTFSNLLKNGIVQAGNSKFKLIPGNIYKVLDLSYNTSGKSLINSDLQKTFNAVLEDESNVLKDSTKQLFKESINTPEKLFHYLYQTKVLGTVPYDAITNINKAVYKYYQVIQVSNEGKNYTSYVSEVHLEDINKVELPPQNKLPMHEAMTGIYSNLAAHSDISISLDYAEDIAELAKQNPNLELSSAKAFIFNNTIHINMPIATPSDLLHEYTHLFLGALKATDPANYQDILNSYIKFSKNFNLEHISSLPQYAHLSAYEKVEELLAEDYSKYIMNKQSDVFFRTATNNSESVLEEVNKEVNSIMPIDKCNSMGDLYTVLHNQIDTTMESLPSDKLTAMLKKSQLSRQISNFMKDKIESKEIIENCN